MRYILAAILLWLTSCSPAWHLQKAQQKGAKVSVDTVFRDVITESRTTDTVTHFQTVDRILAGDTVVINTFRWKLKERIDTVTKTRYVQVECKPDTLRIPVEVTTEISAGYTSWQLVGSVVGSLVFAAAVAYGVYKMAGLVNKTKQV